jgi:hypothetical protein
MLIRRLSGVKVCLRFNVLTDFQTGVEDATTCGDIQSVSGNTFEPNNSVIFQRIFVKFKMQINILDGEE